MSNLPHPNISYDGLIRWLSGELGRPALEGEIAYLRVVMYYRDKRQHHRKKAKQASISAQAKRIREDNADQERQVYKRLQRELEDDLWFCAILSVKWNYELREPAKNTRESALRTAPKPIFAKINKDRPIEITWNSAPARQHRAMLRYIVSKMPELARRLPESTIIPDKRWLIGEGLLAEHMLLINGVTPDRAKAIFHELIADDSTGRLNRLRAEGIRAAADLLTAKELDEEKREKQKEALRVSYSENQGRVDWMKNMRKRQQILADVAAEWPTLGQYHPYTLPTSDLPDPKRQSVDDIVEEGHGLGLDLDSDDFSPVDL